MKWTLDQEGGWGLNFGGKKAAWAGEPLEMEMGGKVYRAPWQGLWDGQWHGFLADDMSPFLRCDVSFKTRYFKGFKVLEEKRTYKALRNLRKTLLTVRVFMEPVRRIQDGFLVIPALWYGDNEAWNNKIIYPKGLDKDWSFKADGSSCPAVVWTTPRSSYALAVDHSVYFPVRRPGMDDILGIGFADMKANPQAVLTFPAQEIPKSYPWGRKLKDPLEPRMDWKKGQALTITLYHSVDKADLAYHTKVWRAHGIRVSKPFRYKTSQEHLKKTAGLFAHCLKESHYREGQGFSHRNDISEIHTGWCGGLAAAYSALKWGDLSGDMTLRRMGETMCDFISAEGVSPSGIFYSEYTKGLWLQKVFWGKAQGIHMRNPSEGACYLALILQHEEERGHFHFRWDEALRKNLDAILKMQRKDGAIPHEINGKTGKALSWVGATSGAWAGALAIYSRVCTDKAKGKKYLAAAKRAGDHYLKNYVERERYIGGPYDTYMVPNMEDPYNLLLAYSELYETTGEKKWLTAAKKTADHLLSWRYLYDVRFPDGTVCRQQKVKTFHMSPASVSNKHIQNWDTLADTYLERLSRWTRDPFYADCALQHLEASTQLVQKGQLPKKVPYGGQSEQWYATDFNWFGDSGNYSKGNMWKVSVALPKAGFLISLTDLLTKKAN